MSTENVIVPVSPDAEKKLLLAGVELLQSAKEIIGGHAPADSPMLDQSTMSTAVCGLMNAAVAGGMDLQSVVAGVGAGLGYQLAPLTDANITDATHLLSKWMTDGINANRLRHASTSHEKPN